MSTSTPQPKPTPPAAKPAPKAAAPAAPAKKVPEPKKAAPVEEPELASIGAEEEEEHSGVSANFLLFNAAPSYLISFVMHMIIIIVMAFMTVPPAKVAHKTTIVASAPSELEEVEEFEPEITEQLNLDPNATVSDSSEVVQNVMQDQVDPVVIVDAPSTDIDAAAVQVELQDFGEKTAPKNDLMKDVGALMGTGLSGRGAAARGTMVAQGGGTDASEKAVAMALKWFADHQNPDGSWNFDHRTGPCAGRCSEAGNLTDCTTGATGLALLPFLGAGQTHKEGTYRKTVERGLYYLTSRMKVKNGAGDLAEGGGSMYSHGIASIVLCEGYAMTHDKGLLAPAQLAINHIVYAQDPVGGGWRYQPRQPGDTSAVGWQLMALKSGHMAYLKVPPGTIVGAIKFLDSVQVDGGSQYGYTGPGNGPATSAIGLLSRMYLGWKQDNPALQRGAAILAKSGPSNGNMYYNYYATQVMRHNGGEAWETWNKKMRDFLVEKQAKTGHETGSWFLKGGDHGSERGGRVYVTAMATMILEVYYRHMPIYGKQAAEEDFPL